MMTNPHEAEVAAAWKQVSADVEFTSEVGGVLHIHAADVGYEHGTGWAIPQGRYRIDVTRVDESRAEADLPAPPKCDALWTNGLGQEGWCAFTAGHNGPHSFETRPVSQSVEEAQRERLTAYQDLEYLYEDRGGRIDDVWHRVVSRYARAIQAEAAAFERAIRAETAPPVSQSVEEAREALIRALLGTTDDGAALLIGADEQAAFAAFERAVTEASQNRERA